MDVSSKESYVCNQSNYVDGGSDNIRWAASVAAFGMILMNSQYLGNSDTEIVLELARSTDYAEDPYKCEFIDIVNKYIGRNEIAACQ